MHSSLDVKGLINFYTINIDTGQWEPVKDEEHPSTAVPKVVHQLERRTEKIIENLATVIRDTITKVQDIQAIKIKFHQQIDSASAELNKHIEMLKPFTEMVRGFIRSENERSCSDHPSPRQLLQKINKLEMQPPDKDARGKSSQHFLTIMNTHERLDHQEIANQLESTTTTLQKLKDILPKIEFCWNQMIKLDIVDDPQIIISYMWEIQDGLKAIQSDESFSGIYEAFFTVDDASAGLLHVPELHVDLEKIVAVLKLTRTVQRTFLRGLNKYKNSDEQVLVDCAFKQIKKFNEYNIQAEHIQALEKVPFYLEIEPSANYSIEVCFRKFGELHANIRKKRFELASLNPLQKYFPEELIERSNEAIAQINELHQKFIAAFPKPRTSKRMDGKESLQDLEITAKMLENSLVTGTEHFFETGDKLHSINHKISKRYAPLKDPIILQNFVDILGSDLFIDFVTTLSKLMYQLKEEKIIYPDKKIESDDLKMIGIVTGETVMIKSYESALNVIVASLNNFMCNSLHQLVQEMLKNTPRSNSEARAKLKKAYEVISKVLSEIDGNLLRESSALERVTM